MLRVGAPGLDAPPWIAAEAAFQIADPTGWCACSSGCPCTTGPDFDRFVADDFARKWCMFLSAKDELYTTQPAFRAFCTPVVGAPHPEYVGLYQPVAAPTYAVPLASNEAFKLLSDLIGQPESVTDLSSNKVTHLRFNKPSAARVVDVVWRKEIFDALNTFTTPGEIGLKTVHAPSPPQDATVYDSVLDDTPQFSAGVTQIVLAGVGQAPKIVVWTP
jgi:hypothetical protein